MGWSTVTQGDEKTLGKTHFLGEDRLGWPESMFVAIYRTRVLFSAQDGLTKISSLLMKENIYLFEKDIWKMMIVDLYTTKNIGILYFIDEKIQFARQVWHVRRWLLSGWRLTIVIKSSQLVWLCLWRHDSHFMT